MWDKVDGVSRRDVSPRYVEGHADDDDDDDDKGVRLRPLGVE